MLFTDLLRLDQKNNLKQSPKKILVVDDEEDIRTVLKKGLEIEGFSVDENSNPKEVLEKYQPGWYDLLLIDIRMPEMSGFELYREIRKIDNKVRVCFITAFEIYYDEFKRMFPKIHVSCFIQKPLSINQLSKAIKEELARPPSEESEQTIKQHNTRQSPSS